MKVSDNVNLDKIHSFAEQIVLDPSKARKTQVMEGEWILAEGAPQFRSAIKFEEGETVFQIDSPTFMGGGGTMPGPLHYCFFGLLSCYTAVFASALAELGIELSSLKSHLEADINFSRVFGVNNDPVMEEIRVVLQVVSDAPEEKIREAEQMALERCPAVYTLRNQVSLSPSLEIVKQG